MGGENPEVVRRALAAVSRRDLPGIVEHADADIELRPLLSVWQRHYRGPAGIEQWLSDAEELWEDFGVEADNFNEVDDDTLIVQMRWRGRAKGTASEYEGPAAALVRFRAGKVIEVDIHLDEQRALEAATSSD